MYNLATSVARKIPFSFFTNPTSDNPLFIDLMTDVIRKWDLKEFDHFAKELVTAETFSFEETSEEAFKSAWETYETSKLSKYDYCVDNIGCTNLFSYSGWTRFKSIIRSCIHTISSIDMAVSEAYGSVHNFKIGGATFSEIVESNHKKITAESDTHKVLSAVPLDWHLKITDDSLASVLEHETAGINPIVQGAPLNSPCYNLKAAYNCIFNPIEAMHTALYCVDDDTSIDLFEVRHGLNADLNDSYLGTMINDFIRNNFSIMKISKETENILKNFSKSPIADYNVWFVKSVFLYYVCLEMSLTRFANQQKIIGNHYSCIMQNGSIEDTWSNYMEVSPNEPIPEAFVPAPYRVAAESYCAPNSIFMSLEAGFVAAGTGGFTAKAKGEAGEVAAFEGKYKNMFIGLKKLQMNIFKSTPSKLKSIWNARFFKKWYGRVPSMYKIYGGAATITENTFKGDPTDILLNQAPQYIANISNETDQLLKDLVNMSQRLGSATGLMGKFAVVKGFCEHYTIDITDDPKQIAKQIAAETYYRVAGIILQNNDVYGYTPDGAAENHKLPAANKIVASLFLSDAQEAPKEQMVTDIFKNPNSIVCFAHPEILKKLESNFQKASSNIINTFNVRNIVSTGKVLKKNMKLAAKSVSRGKKDESGEDYGDNANPKAEKKMLKCIEAGIAAAMVIVCEQKKRCLQCIGVAQDMIINVQKLAMRAIAALHQTELSKVDVRYNRDAHALRFNGLKQYRYARQNAINVKHAANVNQRVSQQWHMEH